MTAMGSTNTEAPSAPVPAAQIATDANANNPSADPEDVTLDSILKYIGQFGRFQLIIFMLICLPMMFHAMFSVTYVFTAATVSHRWIYYLESVSSVLCSNLTFTTDAKLRNVTVPTVLTMHPGQSTAYPGKERIWTNVIVMRMTSSPIGPSPKTFVWQIITITPRSRAVPAMNLFSAMMK